MTNAQPPAGDGQPSKEECAHTLEQVYEFLDHELDSASAETIRHHLAACEGVPGHLRHGAHGQVVDPPKLWGRRGAG